MELLLKNVSDFEAVEEEALYYPYIKEIATTCDHYDIDVRFCRKAGNGVLLGNLF